MTDTTNCLIRQSDCGLQTGQIECPKCGMRTDARYVSKEDMDAALATANATWKRSEKSEAAKRAIVKPGNVEETAALPDKKEPETAKLKTEQTASGQELSGSKPSLLMAWVIGGLLVLGSSSFAYFQHKESEAKLARVQQSLEEAQRKAQDQLIAMTAAPAPAETAAAVPDIPSPQDNLIKVTRKFNDPVTPDRLKQIQQKKYTGTYRHTVLDELFSVCPELIDLIFETKLLDSNKKQYWFDILPAMNDQQMSNLFVLLETSRLTAEELLPYSGRNVNK